METQQTTESALSQVQTAIPVSSDNKMNFIKNPKKINGLLIILVISMIYGFLVPLLPSIQTKVLPVSNFSPWALSLLFLFVGIISASILNFTTRILKIENRSFARSIMFAALALSISIILSILSTLMPIKIPVIVNSILVFVISIFLFGFIYQTKFLKSLITLILSSIFSSILFIAIVIAGIIFFSGVGIK